MPIINQITKGGGTTPTGSVTITNNGTYDVTNKATAVVNVPTTAPALYREFEIDAYGNLAPNTTTTHIMDFTGVKNIKAYVLYEAYKDNQNITGTVDMSDLEYLSSGDYCCAYAFYNTKITGIDLSSLRYIGGGSAKYCCDNMFCRCSQLTNVNLSSLEHIYNASDCQYMFSNCTALQSINLNKLIDINKNGLYYGFSGCTALQSVDVSALTSVYANGLEGAFWGCPSLPSMTFPVLSTISNYGLRACFQNCTSLTSLSFPALTSTSFGSYTNQFNKMLQGVTGCTVHFPSNLQSVIGSWSDVVAGFGGTNTTVLFDLPATE